MCPPSFHIHRTPIAQYKSINTRLIISENSLFTRLHIRKITFSIKNYAEFGRTASKFEPPTGVWNEPNTVDKSPAGPILIKRLRSHSRGYC